MRDFHERWSERTSTRCINTCQTANEHGTWFQSKNERRVKLAERRIKFFTSQKKKSISKFSSFTLMLAKLAIICSIVQRTERYNRKT